MRRRFIFITAASDLLALALGTVVASQLVFDTPLAWEAATPPGTSIIPFLGLLAGGAILGSYGSVKMWARGVPRPSYGRGVAIVTFAIGLTSLGVVLTRVYWSRPFLAITVGSWILGALAHRAWRRRRPWTEAMVLITDEKGLADDLRQAHHADVIQVFDPQGEAPAVPPEPGATLVVDLRSVLSERMAQFVSSTNLAGFLVRALSSVYEEHTGRMALVHLAEGWELSTPVSRNTSYAPFKRGFDVFLVVITSPIWLPLAGLIWLAVKIESRGPVIYKQRRIGYRGAEFTLYKFRTMIADAEREGPQFAALGDERLTKVGKVLRRFRIDEIPQLWNVLKGDLSLVGPRPEQLSFATSFEESIPFYGYRHLVRPGVTGWAQVNYGYADDTADTVQKLTYDLYYVKHMSPWLDMRILGQSIWTVTSGFGAQ